MFDQRASCAPDRSSVATITRSYATSSCSAIGLTGVDDKNDNRFLRAVDGRRLMRPRLSPTERKLPARTAQIMRRLNTPVKRPCEKLPLVCRFAVALRCLRALGVRIDSSYNPCYHPELSFPEGPLRANVVECIEGVPEIPVTVSRTRLREGHNGFKFADCSSISVRRIREILDAAAAQQQHLVTAFHSFSAVKARDETHADLPQNGIVIRRLEEMFPYARGQRRQISGGHDGARR